jgi:hypothetical protein
MQAHHVPLAWQIHHSGVLPMPSAVTKARTLRLDVNDDAALEALARVDGVTVTDAIRMAIHRYIAERRADPDFQRRVEESIEQNQELLRRLAGS